MDVKIEVEIGSKKFIVLMEVKNNFHFINNNP